MLILGQVREEKVTYASRVSKGIRIKPRMVRAPEGIRNMKKKNLF